MPLPLLGAAAAKKGIELIGQLPVLKGLAGRLRKPSEARAADVGRQALASALDGNLTAVRMIGERQFIGIEREKAVWRGLWSRIPPALQREGGQDPDVPGVDQSTPESAVRDALQFAYYGASGARGIRSRGGVTTQEAESANDRLRGLTGALSGGGGTVRQGTGAATGSTSQTATGKRATGRTSRSRAALSSDRSDTATLTKAERRRLGLTTRKVVRYNPDTGRKVSVYADSEEAAQWPSRKPSARLRKAQQQAEHAISRGALAGAGAFSRKVGAAGAAAGLGAGATVAAVGAAFAVGYAIGTAALAIIDHYSADQVNERKALAFRAARTKWASEHGRPMSADEVREMGRGYKAAIPRSLGGTK